MNVLVEKSLKRYLKRKVKITLGFITAFLIMGISAFSEDNILEITQGDKGEILFNGKVFDEENHEFLGNTFENGIYTNNNIMKINNSKDYVLGIAISNNAIPEMKINGIKNNGTIEVNSLESYGIYLDIFNNTNKFDISNIGIIKSSNYGIENGVFTYEDNQISRRIGDILNIGVISATDVGIYNTIGSYQRKLEIDNIFNKGMILVKNETKGVTGITATNGVIGEFYIKDFRNDGIISISGKGSTKGINISDVLMENSYFTNYGVILAKSNDETDSLKLNATKSLGIKNSGIIGSYFEKNGISGRDVYGINLNTPRGDNELSNTGIIYSLKESTSSSDDFAGIYISISNNSYEDTKDTTVNLINKGIVIGEKNAIKKEIFDKNSLNLKLDNYGILANKTENKNIIDINNNNQTVTDTINNYGLMFTIKNDGTYELEESYNKTVDNVINAELKSDKTGTESFKLSEKDYDNSIINGITDTLEVDSSKTITGSIINGYTNAVVFTENGNSLTLAGTVVNGGLSNIDDENSEVGTAILGGDNSDNLILKSADNTYKNGETINEGTIVNGNIDLGNGNDNLTIDSKTQINGNLLGGDGEDTLKFTLSENSQTFSNDSNNILENSMNILHDISGFEKTNIDTNVTLFENITAELGDITIEKNGNLILRIDTTNRNSHALFGNKGIIRSDGGKLLLATNGLGSGTEIDLDNTLDESIKGSNSEGVEFEEDLTIDTISFLHDVERIDGNDTKVKIVAESDLPSIDDRPENPYEYNKLNDIYHSIVTSKQDGEFTGVTKEKYNSFLKYLHDIYAGSPYAFSSELSRKSMDIFKSSILSKDLKPELNKWAIYGGLTHIDGGTKDEYYGKGYYTYDVGSRDINADTKITGAYMQAEYGKSETFTTGIVFGGNNSETEVGASKVEGDSFYFGAYAKKYLNDFRFTLGAGFQHGDYKADRTALGYEGITTTRDFSENYHDRGFNIYGDIKYSKEITENLFIEPYFTLGYSYVDQDGVSEDGVLAIETDSKNFDYATGKVGLDIKKVIPMENGKHILTAGLSYENILSGDDEKYITGRFKGGSDFDILVPEKNSDIFSLNGKYEYEFENGFMFDVKGTYTFENDNMEDEWVAGIGVGYRF